MIARYGHYLLLALALAVQIWSFGSTFTLIGKPFPGFRFEPTLTMASMNLPTWTGPAAGLAQQDRILEIDGKTAKGPTELWHYVRALPIGTSVSYVVEGDQGHRKLTAATMRYGWKDWLFNVLPMAGVSIAFWVIGALGFVWKATSPAARAHGVFTCAMAAYLSLTNDYDIFAFLGAWYPASIYFLGSAAIHLALEFPVRAKVLARRPWILHAIYGPVLVLGIAAAALYRPLARPVNPSYDAYSTLYWSVGASWLLLGVVVLLVSLVARSWRSGSASERQQAKLALFGATLAFVPMAVLWAVPTLLHVDPQTTSMLVGSTLIFFFLFPLAVGYAIIRTQLFDIDLVIKRTLQYAVLISLLGTLYFSVMVGAGYALQKLLPAGASDATNALAAAVAAFAFAPISQRTQKVLDRVFSRQAYDPAQVLNHFGVATRMATDIASLFEAFDEAVSAAFSPHCVRLAVPGLESHQRGVGPTALSETLKSGEEGVGVASLGAKRSDLPYSTSDKAFLSSLCHQLALAVENTLLITRIRSQERVAKELEIAHEVQAGLLPTSLPEVPGVQIAAINEAALEMGGDFYDVVELEDGALGIVLGDVSGKGVPAALLGAVCLTLFRAIAPRYGSPIDTLDAINELLLKHRASRKMFVAFTYVVYHPLQGWAVGVNAGNPAPLHAGVPIASKGMPLGATRKPRYCDFELILEPGQTLVMLSDGATDARNSGGDRYGDDRLCELVARHADRDPADLLKVVRGELDAFQGERALYDDLTILALRRVLVPSPVKSTPEIGASVIGTG